MTSGLIRARCTLAFLLVASMHGALADGIVLLKQYNTSPAGEISEALVFKTYVDRTAVYDFTWRNGKRGEIDKARLVRMIPIPNPASFPEHDATSIERLTKELAAIQKLASQFPKLGEALAPDLKALGNEIALFKQGNKKIAGQWITGAEYQKQRSAEMAAEADREKTARVNELSATLSAADTDVAKAAEIVAELERLKSPSPRANSLVMTWKDGHQKAQSLKGDLRRFLDKLSEKRPLPYFTEVKAPADIRQLPDEYRQEMKALDSQLTKLTATEAFPSLRTIFQEEAACFALTQRITAMAERVAAEDLTGAAKVCADPVPVSPEELRGRCPFVRQTLEQCELALLTTIANAKTRLKNAQELQNAQRISAAIKEYEEANKTLKDAALTELIKQLRKQTLGL